MIQVVTLTGTLTYTGEYGISAVLGCDITDQLLDQYSLTYTGTTEQTDLTTLLIRAEQVNDLNTGLQQFCVRRLLCEGRCSTVDRLVRYPLRYRLVINRLTQYIKYSAQGIFSYRHGNRSSCGDCLHSSYQSVGSTHGDTSDSIITQVLGDFYYQFSSISGRDADRVIDLGKFALIEAYIQYGTDDLGDPSFILSCHFYLFPARYAGIS